MTTEEGTAGEDTTAGPAAPVAAGAWRPGKRAKIGAVVFAVLLVVGVTGGILITNHNADAPVDAVREYVDAIARGDASAANRMVDPGRFADGVDRDLLTDEVLRSAKQRITIEDVRLDYDADLSGGVVAVQVEYKLGPNSGATVELRAKRAGSTALVLREWQVLDPLLVPVSVGVNEPRLDTASFGAATVPAGSADSAWPERRFFVYPGVYELRGHESRYLTAAPKDVVATSTVYEERPENTDGQRVESWLSYEATPELIDTVRAKLATHTTACFAAVPNVPRNCPDALRLEAGYATGIRLDRQPEIESIQAYQVDYAERAEPALRMQARDGRFSYTTDYGERGDAEFSVYAHLFITPEDELTITFTETL